IVAEGAAHLLAERLRVRQPQAGNEALVLRLRPAGADRIVPVGAGKLVLRVQPVDAAPGAIVGDRHLEERLRRRGGEDRPNGAPFAVSHHLEALRPGADLDADRHALGRPAARRISATVGDDVAARLAEGEVRLPLRRRIARLAGLRIGIDERHLLGGALHRTARRVWKVERALDHDDDVFAAGLVHAHGELMQEAGLVPDLHQDTSAPAMTSRCRAARGAVWSISSGPAPAVANTMRSTGAPAGPSGSTQAASSAASRSAPSAPCRAADAACSIAANQSAAASRSSIVTRSHGAASVSGNSRPMRSELGTITPAIGPMAAGPRRKRRAVPSAHSPAACSGTRWPDTQRSQSRTKSCGRRRVTKSPVAGNF